MQNFKVSYIWVLFIFFLSGKVDSAISPVKVNAFLTEHKKELKKEFKTSQKITGDTGDESCPKKRKIKKRGLSGTVPQIQDITFLSVVVHKTFKSYNTVSSYTSFLYCVSLKRGPPQA